ncbi:MAG TPA: flagellar biosynthetic protein FliR [Candidatus Tumulicola sp.]
MSATLLLVFARCTGFIVRAPGISHPSVGAPVRAGLALLLTLGALPGVRSVRAPLDAMLLPAMLLELLVGVAIGTAASLVYDAAYAGGRAIDDYVGVKAIAPNVQLVAPSGFGRVWSIAYTGAFFLLGAYRIAIPAFVQTFARVPPGSPPGAYTWAPFCAGLARAMIEAGVAVAGPVIATAFVVQIALGSLSRAVPRFGSTTLAFPLVFGAALVATALTVTSLSPFAVTPVSAVPARR